MGNGWVGPYNPVYVQPSGGRERWWIRKQQKTSCHGKAESLRMTGKTLRKFNIYRHPEKSPGHKNGKDRVPSTIFSATRFVHFLRLCMLELPLPPSNQHYFIFGKSQPQKKPFFNTCDCYPRVSAGENPLLGAPWTICFWGQLGGRLFCDDAGDYQLQGGGSEMWPDGAMLREVPYII